MSSREREWLMKDQQQESKTYTATRKENSRVSLGNFPGIPSRTKEERRNENEIHLRNHLDKSINLGRNHGQPCLERQCSSAATMYSFKVYRAYEIPLSHQDIIDQQELLIRKNQCQR